MTTLLTEIDAFVKRSGLSEHRVGIILAKNGRLIERLRSGSRIWPETEIAIRAQLRVESERRGLTETAKGAA